MAGKLSLNIHSGESDSAVYSTCEKVLISTLYPLGKNYGGMLQAFALQQVLKTMGFEVQTINSSLQNNKARFLASRVRFQLKKLLKKDPGVFPLSDEQTRSVYRKTLTFVSRHIDTVDLFEMSKKQRVRYLEQCKAIVVGSDQVWRGGYAHIPTQLLDYAKNLRLLKISYAASFGADSLIRYSSRLKSRAKELASHFDAISVREKSGIQICRNEWDVEAQFHIDPTLLLDATVYLDLLKDSGIEVSSHDGGGLVSYILDESDDKRATVTELANRMNLSFDEILTVRPEGGKEWMKDPNKFVVRSVEEWLKKFIEADFIVTDSFHGTVFAILFQKPFVTIGNPARGLARFDTLLYVFGLENRLMKVGESIDSLDLSGPDWNRTKLVLDAERARAFSYLKANLSNSTRSTT